MTTDVVKPREITCHLIELGLVGEHIYQVRLEWPQGGVVPFYAGQYLAVHIPNREPAWFSIASSPDASQLTLHVQAPPELESAVEIIDFLKSHGYARLSLPYGEACFSSVPDAPLVLIVAGTGFAQAKSVVDYLRHQGMQHPVYLYWGVKSEDEMYLRAQVERWDEEWPEFKFRPVICGDDDAPINCHHEGLVDAIRADGHDFSRVRVLASGSPTMVYNVVDALAAHGLNTDHVMSDVFQYAPRDPA